MADAVVVEGVGGFRVPLSTQRDSADLAQQLGLPVVMVVGLRLGCLNHALLSVDAILSRPVRLAGWIASGIDPQMEHLEENLSFLHKHITAPCLGVIPPLPAGENQALFAAKILAPAISSLTINASTLS